MIDRDGEIAYLRSAIAAQQARLERMERRRRILPKRLYALVLMGLFTAFAPLSILASGPTFSDLNDAATVHRPNIRAIGDAGITTGFEDPNNPSARLYNPTGLVTREEMASFLARTAGLGGNPPVANALTAQTAQTATSADQAANAALLGGHPPSYYQPAGQPVANAINAVDAQNAVTAANAVTLGGYGADGLGRLAASGTVAALSYPATSMWADLGEVALTIPGPTTQTVLVNGIVGLYGQASGGWVDVRITDISGGGYSTIFAFPYLTTANHKGITPMFQWVFIADPGVHTYRVQVRVSGTTGPLTADNLALIATSHPFLGTEPPAGWDWYPDIKAIHTRADHGARHPHPVPCAALSPSIAASSAL